MELILNCWEMLVSKIKRNNSVPNVKRFISGPCLKENKELGLDLTNNMENNLFSIKPPSPQLKGRGISFKAQAS